MWVPTTPYTQTLSYNQRVLINDEGRKIPIAWELSKVLDTIPVGITRLTFKQVQADMHSDCSKYGIANFCNSGECEYCTIIEPFYIDAGLEMPGSVPRKGRITYNGKDAALRVGGSSKTFTAEYWDEEFIPYNAFWTISLVDGENILSSINAYYNGFWNITQASTGFDLDVSNGEVKCSIDNKDIFKIKLEAFDNSIKLSCAQLYNMVGKNIVLSAKDADGENEAEIIMEVIS